MIRHILISAFILVFTGTAFSQDIHFGYDDNGNRTSQAIIDLRSAAIPENGKVLVDTLKSHFTVCNTELEIIIFPNPVKSKLNVQVKGELPSGSKKINIHAMDGSTMYTNESLDTHIIIDLAALPEGIYILAINFEDTVNTWKIIKQ